MRILVAGALCALALASVAAAASSAPRWMTESAVVRVAEARGVTLNDGSRIRPIAGYCLGTGAHRGTLALPSFTRFRCTLATSTGGGSAWYDLRLFALDRGLRAVVLGRY